MMKIETDIARYLIKNFLSKFCEIKQESILDRKKFVESHVSKLEEKNGILELKGGAQ